MQELEARVAYLERRLRESEPRDEDHRPIGLNVENARTPFQPVEDPLDHNPSPEFPAVIGSQGPATLYTLLQSAPSKPAETPFVPSACIAQELLDAAFFHTQTRYCMVDWVNVRQWDAQRNDICLNWKESSQNQRVGTVLHARYQKLVNANCSRRFLSLAHLCYWSTVDT